MTAPDTGIAIAPVTAPVATRASQAQPAWRRWLLFGDGLGIAVSGRNLEVAVVRTRPGESTLLASTTIAAFRDRPAAEWGAELSRFLAAAKQSHLAATIVLPREEVIVRTVALPGVAEKDVASAIELQIDTLHPWSGDEVAWSWTRVSAGAVLVGIVRGADLTAWETLFSEAGVGVAAITFSAAAIYPALRLRAVLVDGAAPASFLFFDGSAADKTGPQLEIYGESDARPVYSTEFSMPAERALSIARAELRMPPDTVALPLRSAVNAQGDAATLAWTAALVSSAPILARPANFIPAERRVSHSRIQYAIPAALAALLILALIAVFVILPAIDRRRTVSALQSEIRRLEPPAARAQNLERSITTARAQMAALAEVCIRPQRFERAQPHPPAPGVDQPDRDFPGLGGNRR
jgi:hypothetical protein